MKPAPVSADCEIWASSSSTLPPGPNQARPLWENDGQPWTKTTTISASSSATTPSTSAPSNRSTRWSDHFGPYSGWKSSSNSGSLLLGLLVERCDATGFVDDFAGFSVATGPGGELLHRRARVFGRQHEEDVPRQRVLQRFDADVLRFAGNPVHLDRGDALFLPGETGVADRVRVLLDRVDDEAVGGQSVDVRRREFVVEHGLEEERVGASIGVTPDRVDRRGQVRPTDLGPVRLDAPVDVVERFDADVFDLVRRVDVHAEPVEVQLDVGRPCIAGERGTSLAGELAGAGLNVFDAGVAAVRRVGEVDALVLLFVCLEKGLQHRLRGHGTGPDQGLCPSGRRSGES